jgi:thioesterase domain-containing protein
MVPAACVRLERLPLTPNGKLDRTALSAPEAAARPGGAYEPPQDGIESSMAAIWAEILHLEHVGKNDNFFDLGGHSLLIARLLARVKRDMGICVPVATIFQHSTLHDFSAALAESMEATHPQPKVSSLGPLLWVGGGDYLREIAAELQPVCEVRPLWIQDGYMEALRPPVSIEVLAGKLAGVIRKHYPEGPYLVGGYCNHAILAYETAQQLRGMGCEVALLAIVDAFNPTMTLTDKLSGRLRKELFHLYALAGAPSKEWRPYLLRYSKGISLRYEHWRHGHKNISLGGEPMEWDVEQVLQIAIRRYSPQYYAGRVAFFQATDRSWIQYRRPGRDWRPLVGKESEFHEVPGDHLSMMDAAHIGALARQLRATILEVSAERNRHEMAGLRP